MLPIALDAMGGDHAPSEIIAGAQLAAKELGVSVTLVGRPDEIGGDTGHTVYPASEVIDMADDPARAVRVMKDASIVRSAELVRDGVASAMVSAGNTGAAVSAALLRMGRIRGVSRPAVATTLPVPGTTPKILLDSGAMADCQASWLLQYAQMGSVFARVRYGIEQPKVGLMSIGEEPGKGNQLVKETYALLAADQSINFIGNIEGRDVLGGDVDVIVTDGFTGNVILKTLEGTVKFLVEQIIGLLTAEDAPASGVEALGLLAPLAAEMSPDAVGGSMLLGVNGVCIISHGSSSAVAIRNAISVAHDMVETDLVAALTASVAG
jgi:glycerol-3-phosphate acyltransferase PlsX